MVREVGEEFGDDVARALRDHLDELRTNAGVPPAWADRHVTEKLKKYLEARQHMPGYEHAPLGIEFTRAGADPVFRQAVEDAVAEFPRTYPGVDVDLTWPD